MSAAQNTNPAGTQAAAHGSRGEQVRLRAHGRDRIPLATGRNYEIIVRETRGRVIEYHPAKGARRPPAFVPYILHLGDGSQRRGLLDGTGYGRQEDCPEGAYRFEFPGQGPFDKSERVAWEREELKLVSWRAPAPPTTLPEPRPLAPRRTIR